MTLPTAQALADLAEIQDMARGTIGMAVIAMMRSAEPISRAAIEAFLADIAAERRTQEGLAPFMAAGALRFIATLR